jgi:hypothetical protein
MLRGVKLVDFMHLAVADVDKRWECAPKVKQGVQFGRDLDLAKWSPVKQAHSDQSCASLASASVER